MANRYEYIVNAGRFISPGLQTSSLPPRRRPAGASGEAVLRWGAASDFQISSSGGVTVQVRQPAYDDLPDGDENLGLIFTETERQTTVVRITNPLDANVYVDVEVIDQISFLGPDGEIRTFVLNN